MYRIALVALACIAVDGAWCLAALQEVRRADTARLQGRWEVVSMRQSGWQYQTQIGAFLSFDGDQVKSQPKVVQFMDGTS